MGSYDTLHDGQQFTFLRQQSFIKHNVEEDIPSRGCPIDCSSLTDHPRSPKKRGANRKHRDLNPTFRDHSSGGLDQA